MTPKKAGKNGARKSAAIVLDNVESVVPGEDATTDENELVSVRRPKGEK